MKGGKIIIALVVAAIAISALIYSYYTIRPAGTGHLILTNQGIRVSSPMIDSLGNVAYRFEINVLISNDGGSRVDDVTITVWSTNNTFLRSYIAPIGSITPGQQVPFSVTLVTVGTLSPPSPPFDLHVVVNSKTSPEIGGSIVLSLNPS